MRVITGGIFAWDAHLTRLSLGLHAFGLPCPQGLLAQCLSAAAAVADDAMLRLTISGGEAPRGLMALSERHPEVHIQAWPYQRAVHPLELRSLHWPMGSVARTAKFTSDYAFTIRLLHQARHAGLLADAEQALFTHENELLCMETANVLLHMDGRWCTPDHAAVLPGVVRGALIASGVVHACPCPVDWLLVCDAMAICNSGCFIRPVAVMNGRRLDRHAGLFTPLLDAMQGRAGVPTEIVCV